MALKPRKFDVEDSNILDIFTAAFEEKLKVATETPNETWKDAGKEAGLQAWRVEKSGVTVWPKEQHGVFYTQENYLYLRTHKTDSGLVHDIHFWVGEDSSLDDYTASVFRVAELDTALGATSVQHREVEGHESSLFLSYFKITHFHDGTSLVPKKEDKNRLLHLKGTKNVVSRQVPLHIGSLNSGHVFILDAGHDVYLFNGKDSGAMERAKGVEITKAIAAAHTGAVVVNTISEDDATPAAAAFWKLLGGKQPIAAASPESDAKHEKHLFRLSDETGKVQLIEMKPVSRKTLSPKDVFILDAGHHIFVWVGAEASKQERSRAIAYGTDYLFSHKRPRSTPISRVVEGHESEAFLHAINV